MKSPYWEVSTGALLAFLNSLITGNVRQAPWADLYTFTLLGGQVLRYTGADRSLTVGGRTFTAGPIIERDRISRSTSLQVDSLSLSISSSPGVTVNGVPFMKFLAQSGLLGAALLHERLFYHDDGGGSFSPVGSCVEFSGTVGAIEGGRHTKQVTVNSDLQLLDVSLPRDVYQPYCRNTLFDANCGVSRASFTYSSSASAGPTGSDYATIPNTGLALGDHMFDLGKITFTSGANNGVSRTVRQYLRNVSITTIVPFPFAWAPADTFSIQAGCDKSQATCTNRYANVVHFRGEPYIPPPDTIA
jgi:hypothetical protein